MTWYGISFRKSHRSCAHTRQWGSNQRNKSFLITFILWVHLYGRYIKILVGNRGTETQRKSQELKSVRTINVVKLLWREMPRGIESQDWHSLCVVLCCSRTPGDQRLEISCAAFLVYSYSKHSWPVSSWEYPFFLNNLERLDTLLKNPTDCLKCWMQICSEFPLSYGRIGIF
jgi:hypothetical protein